MKTPPQVSDVTQAHALLHGAEVVAFGGAGYHGVEKRPEQPASLTWHVAMRPGKRRALPDARQGRLAVDIERIKASMRARVEHPFHIIKNLFGLANLMIARWCLLVPRTVAS